MRDNKVEKCIFRELYKEYKNPTLEWEITHNDVRIYATQCIRSYYKIKSYSEYNKLTIYNKQTIYNAIGRLIKKGFLKIPKENRM